MLIPQQTPSLFRELLPCWTHSALKKQNEILMLIQELIGKTITNIYSKVEYENYGLDKGECFIELDNEIIIDIPYGESEDVWLKDLDNNAESLFKDLSDYPIYHVNKAQKSIGEIAKNNQKRKTSIWGRLKQFFGQDIEIKENKQYKVEYRENKLKYLQNRIIVDFLWTDNFEKGLLELDNGYFITETTVANNGTGLAGLNYFENIEILRMRKGHELFRLNEMAKGSNKH